MKKFKSFISRTLDIVVNLALARLEGEISRLNQAMTIEAFVNFGATALAVGQVIIYDPSNTQGGLLPSGATDKVRGLLIREVRQGGVTGAATVPQYAAASALKIGYAIVKCVNGTPADGGKVYYRYALGQTGSSTRAIGTIETAAITNEVIELVGATFCGTVDSDGLVEVRFNLQ